MTDKAGPLLVQRTKRARDIFQPDIPARASIFSISMAKSILLAHPPLQNPSSCFTYVPHPSYSPFHLHHPQASHPIPSPSPPSPPVFEGTNRDNTSPNTRKTTVRVSPSRQGPRAAVCGTALRGRCRRNSRLVL